MDDAFSFKLIDGLAKWIPLLSLGFATLVDELVLDTFPLLLSQSCLFYWSIYRPDLLPFSGLFGIGLMGDGFSGGLFGKTFLLFLITFLMGLSQRRSLAQASFSVVWVAFGFYMLSFSLACYVLEVLLLGHYKLNWSLVYAYVGVVVSHPIVSYTLMKTKGLLGKT